MRISVFHVMDISEYERRRNEHVQRRTQELQKLLESSGSSETAVNDLILAQSAASIRPVVERGEGGRSSRKAVNPVGFPGPLRRSERNRRTNGGDGEDISEHSPSTGSRSRSATSAVQVYRAPLSPLHLNSCRKRETYNGNCTHLLDCESRLDDTVSFWVLRWNCMHGFLGEEVRDCQPNGRWTCRILFCSE